MLLNELIPLPSAALACVLKMLPMDPLQYERASKLKRDYLASAFVKTLKKKLKLKKEWPIPEVAEALSVKKLQRDQKGKGRQSQSHGTGQALAIAPQG